MMRRYLLDKSNISRNSIILENRSRNTRGNIRHLARLCQKYRVRRLTIISSGWHLPRVKHIVHTAGLPQVCAVRFLASQDQVSRTRIQSEIKYLTEEKKTGTPPPG